LAPTFPPLVLLEQRRDATFGAFFVALMSRHHSGAIATADEAIRRVGDPRLRVMAHAVRHSQRGEVMLMQGVSRGPEIAAAAALLPPVG
jgi:uncharacterized protein (DUF305 family)